MKKAEVGQPLPAATMHRSPVIEPVTPEHMEPQNQENPEWAIPTFLRKQQS
jgi:hypothetical protein